MRDSNMVTTIVNRILDKTVGATVAVVSRFPVPFIIAVLIIVRAMPFLRKQEREVISGLIGYFRRNRNAVNRVFCNLSPRVKTRIAINYTGNMRIRGPLKRRKLAKALGVRVPDVLFLEVTSKCNLQCAGCYSEIYRADMPDLDMATLERVLDEAQSIGIYTTFLTGGEPLARRKDILALARQFRGMAFGVFTNGILLDDALAAQIEAASNMFFFVSLDGFERSNDAKRGQGAFAGALRATDRLQQHGILFGSSTTVTRTNLDEVLRDEFVELMIEKGCTYMAYLPYLPSGRGWAYDCQFLLRPEERRLAHERIVALRHQYPISIFNSHLNFMGRCGGGGRILYVNTNGDVQPCGPVHFALDNVRGKSLRSIVGSDMMRAYACREPITTNPLRMCWVLDHPQVLREILTESKARPIDPAALGLIEGDLEARAAAAAGWRAVADAMWMETDPKDFLKKLEKSA